MVVLYGLVVGGCFFIGFLVNVKLNKRYKFYEDFLNFLSKYKSNLYFRQLVFRDLIQNEENNDFYCFLEKFANGDEVSVDYLSKEEVKNAKNIIASLGDSGLVSAEEVVSHAEEIVLKNKEIALEKKERLGPLCLKLGFLIGLMIVILLI